MLEDGIIDILLVEDNPADEELTVKALKKNNLANKLVIVRDGVEALDFLFAGGNYSKRNISNRPKLILLDLKLPKIDGLEVLKKIKSDDRMRAIPVVVLTSSNQEKDIVESYKLGVNSYLVKPIDFDNFTKSIAEIGLYWVLLNKPPF